MIRKTLYIVIVVWIAVWVWFTARELFAKGNFKDYNALMRRSLEEKHSFITGDRLYEFLKFCEKKLPVGATYKLYGIDESSIDKVRASYYLYPHLAQAKADFVLVYDVPGSDMYDGKIYMKLDDTRYMVKKRQTK